ncbi:MAG TPA: GNAT family N-acetyltransferase, partial [Actinomycetota bacterium]
ARDATLPEDLRRGDLVAFASTGAYEYAMASTYNKVGRPAVVLVGGDGEARPILRREELGDLARLDVGPPPTDRVPAPPGIEVRPARARDARGVMDLVAEVAAEGRFIRTERVAPSAWPYRARLRRSWTSDGAEIVALEDGKVVGHLGISRESVPALRHVAAIGMSVRRDHRSRGVGSSLMSEAIRWAREVGVEKLSLSVFPHNASAIALYRKFGFVEEGVFRGHTRKSYGYEDEVVMARWV